MASLNEEIEDLNNKFLEFMVNPGDIEDATQEMYEDLVDEVLMGFVYDTHRNAKLGIDKALEGGPEDEKFKIVDAPGTDVFGEPLTRKTGKCNCPNCGQIVVANRFAPHLEKCLGMGRNSSRVASRRISDYVNKQQYGGSGEDDDDDDADWGKSAKRKRKKAKETSRKSEIRTQSEEDSTTSSNSPPEMILFG